MNHGWITHAPGLLVAGVLLLVSVGLGASMPVVFGKTLLVVSRREWIPLNYNVRSIAKRRVAAVTTLFGVALVVFVLTGTFMLASGIKHTLANTGDARNAKILMKGVAAEGQSYLNRGQLNLLSVAPGVARNAEGRPLLSAELLILVWATSAGATASGGANLSLRGVSREGFELHPPRTLRGRRFNPSVFEIVIGKAIEGRFQGATLGGRMTLAGHDWTVVGVADHAGTAHDSEAWADLEQIRSAFRRDASVVTVALEDRASFAELQAVMAQTPQLSNLQIRREVEYWESLGQRYVDFVKLVGCLVGGIFALAAILGAMNTMYAQVSARKRELGALRAIGFRPRAILASLVFESVLLSVTAGVIGIAAASLLAGLKFELTSEKTFTEMSFGFHFSAPIALAGLGCAALLGYAGGLLPAWQASRARIVDAVRVD